MSPSPLPDVSHVVRYVKKKLLRRDSEGTVIGVLPQAFEHREGETYLSVTWIEFYDADYEQGLSKSAEAMRLDLKVKERDGFSVGNVGNLRSVCSELKTRVRVLHEPNPPNNLGHSALRGLQQADDLLRDAIAGDVFVDTRQSMAI